MLKTSNWKEGTNHMKTAGTRKWHGECCSSCCAVARAQVHQNVDEQRQYIWGLLSNTLQPRNTNKLHDCMLAGCMMSTVNDGDSITVTNINKWCCAQQTSNMPQCRVLPPGKFKGTTSQPLPIDSKSFMMTAATKFP